MQSDVQKRRAMRRKKARRRHIKIFSLFILAVALTVAIILCFTTFFPIKRISVSGSKIYSKSEIIKASKLTTKDQVLAISAEKTEQKIRKALPYVDSIKLERKLPDAVIITVTDAKEYAFYGNGDEYLVISQKGYILNKTTEMPQNLLEIVSNGISGEVGSKAEYIASAENDLVEELIALLSAKNISINKIDVSNVLDISVNIENRFTVSFGTDENLSQKIDHLSGMIKSIGDRSGKINLSMWSESNSQGTFVENTE